ncbi:type II toxin-antitoxin system PemK/MazF family toxin [Helicobacter winghamensis]|uniref:type II toxin-antitoxin system PemK/MazF family toxin n=1 Tax=Helicobacter winghamensis TaxID=157268 RepID=UPI00351B885E
MMELSEPIKYGELYFVNFEPQVGAEITKIRPALVLSNDFFNAEQDLIWTVPLTTWQSKFENRLWLIKLSKNQNNGLERDSAINCSQIKSFSKERFKQKIGFVEQEIIKKVRYIINEIMDSRFN